MERVAFYHRAKSSYAYAYDKETLHIKLRTKKGDAKTVKLLYGDPFDFKVGDASGNLARVDNGWNRYEKDMSLCGADALFDYYFVEIKPTWRRIKYAFLISDDKETVVFGENEIADVKNENDQVLYDQSNYFAFPFLNGIDVHSAPEWVKNTIWYQIFPERFENGDKANDPDYCQNWGEPIDGNTQHFGGDLQGVINRLDYLQDLGITGVYFTPVFHADSNHKYDTKDYFKIDPMFGDNELFKKLVEECHKRNIKVMLDGVFNHSGFFYKQFQDVVEKGENSKYKDWFHIKEFPVIKDHVEINKGIYRGDYCYDSFAFTAHMPKWNTENEEVRQMLLDVGRYWVEEYGIDAWRLDVANEVDHNFWRDFRKVVNSTGKECYILAEIWHDAMSWLQGDQFDAVMNYPLRNAMLKFFAFGTMGSEEFVEAIDKANFNYPLNVNENMYNLLDSHDTARIIHLAGENKNKAKLAYAFMFTQIGAPAIYYGGEVGITGADDPDCRRCMIWDEEKQDKDMLSFMKQLIRVRKENPILAWEGKFEWLLADEKNNVVIYRRYKDNNNYFVVINNSDKKVTVKTPELMRNGHLKNLLTEKSVRFEGEFELDAYESAIYSVM